MHNVYNAMRKEATACLALIGGVRKKGFPDSFCEFLQKGVEDVIAAANDATQVYAREIIKQDEGIDEIRAGTAAIEATRRDIEEKLAAARKGCLSDVRKNSIA